MVFFWANLAAILRTLARRLLTRFGEVVLAAR